MSSAEHQPTSFAHLKVCLVAAALGLLRPAAAFSILPLHRTPLFAPDNHNEMFFNFGQPLHGTSAFGSPVSESDKGDDLPDARRVARFALQLQQLEWVNKNAHDDYIAAGYKDGATGGPLAPSSALQDLGSLSTLSASLPASHPHQLLSTDIGESFGSVHHELDAGFSLDDSGDLFPAAGWH